MTQEVSINIKGIQRDDLGQELITEQNVTGIYSEKNDSIYVLYEEKDPENGLTTKNTLKLKDYTVELTRRGAITARMIFEAGKNCIVPYTTPLGTLQLETHTKEVRRFFDESRGHIYLAYSLSHQDSILSECRLELTLNFCPSLSDISVTN